MQATLRVPLGIGLTIFPCMARSSAWLEWFPVAMRYGGLAGVAFLVFVWLLTGRTEAGFLALFGGMMGIGEGIGAIKELVQQRQPPPER